MKKKHIKDLAGQTTYKSINEAFKAISNTLGQLHLEAHQGLLLKRRGG